MLISDAPARQSAHPPLPTHVVHPAARSDLAGLSASASNDRAVIGPDCPSGCRRRVACSG